MKVLQAAAVCLLGCALQARALELQRDRSSPFDLAVKGAPEGTTRYARWSDLRALPTERVTVDGEFLKGTQVLTVVFLSELWKALPVPAGADALLATCGDGYAGVYTEAFISKYRPFLVLEIDGKGPKDWPPPGLAFNPGPYVITVSSGLVPAVADYLDIEHKKPWSVTTIEIARFADRFKGIYTGKWSDLSSEGKAGREIWINSCASCHAGPPETFGGTKADRPFQVIAAYAGYDRPFFMKFVRNPKSLVPSAKMEGHPWYTDEQLLDLISFITAGQK